MYDLEETKSTDTLRLWYINFGDDQIQLYKLINPISLKGCVARLHLEP